MLQILGTFTKIPRSIWTAARRRPGRTALIAVIAVVMMAGVAAVGIWRYALHAWNASGRELEQDEVAEAQKHLDVCLWVWPRSSEVHHRAARAARLAGDLSAAESHLNRCLELDEGATEQVQLEFLLLRVQTGEVDKLATPLFELVENGHPDSPEILKTVALAYILRLRYKPASACLTLWIDRQPNLPRPYHWRGWVLERLNNSKAAMQDYLKALELDPGLVEVRVRVVEMLLEDRLAPEAKPHLDLLIQQAPESPQVQARLGMCRFLEGRLEEARKLMESAVKELPYDPALQVTLANLDLQEGRPADAERRLRTVLETDASDTEALFVLGSALNALGRSDEAEKVVAEFERKRKTVDRINDLLKEADSPSTTAAELAEIGELFLTIGRNRFGVYWLERALDKDPNNPTAQRALADQRARQEREETPADQADRPK